MNGRQRWCDPWCNSTSDRTDSFDWSSPLLTAYCWLVRSSCPLKCFALSTTRHQSSRQRASGLDSWVTTKKPTSSGRRTNMNISCGSDLVPRRSNVSRITLPCRQTWVKWGCSKTGGVNFQMQSLSEWRREGQGHWSSSWRSIQMFELQGRKYIFSIVSITKDLTGTGKVRFALSIHRCVYQDQFTVAVWPVSV